MSREGGREGGSPAEEEEEGGFIENNLPVGVVDDLVKRERERIMGGSSCKHHLVYDHSLKENISGPEKGYLLLLGKQDGLNVGQDATPGNGDS